MGLQFPLTIFFDSFNLLASSLYQMGVEYGVQTKGQSKALKVMET